jgi:hypothetical protein
MNLKALLILNSNHTGAGDTAQTREFGKVRGVKIAAVRGYDILRETGNRLKKLKALLVNN